MLQRFNDVCIAGNIAEVNRIWREMSSWDREISLEVSSIQANGHDELNILELVAGAGHCDVVLRLLQFATPAQRNALLAANNCGAFRFAASGGHRDVIDLLWLLATPAQRNAFLAADDHGAARLAVNNGHLEVSLRLVQLATPAKINAPYIDLPQLIIPLPVLTIFGIPVKDLLAGLMVAGTAMYYYNNPKAFTALSREINFHLGNAISLVTESVKSLISHYFNTTLEVGKVDQLAI